MTPPNTQTSKNNEGFLSFILGRRKLLLLTLFGLAVIVLVGLNAVKKQLETNLSSELQTILRSNQDTLRIWNQEKSSQVKNWANNPNVRSNILSLSQRTLQEEVIPDTLLKSKELEELRRILGPVCNRHNYVEFVVFDLSGLQIGALLDKPVGQHDLIEYSNFVRRSLKGETVVSLPFFSETPLPTIHGQWKENWPTMFISAPVRDDSGEIVAILSFRLRPEIEFSRIMESGRTGESGETYIFNRSGILVSNSRFDDHLRDLEILSDDPDQTSMLMVKLIERGEYFNKRNPRLTRAVRRALKGETGVDINGYPDYRGVMVIGAWTWVEKYGFGLTTKIDLDEAFAPLFIMERVFVSFFILLLAALGSFWFLVTRELKSERERKKVSDLLEDSEKKADLILSNTLDGIVTIHPNGIIQSFNLAAEKIFGYKAEEVIGKNVKRLMPEPYCSEYDRYLKKYLLAESGNILGTVQEVPGRRKDGSIFDLEIAISEIFLQDERVFIGLARDITERKRLEALSNRMGRILDDSFNEFYIFDVQTFKYVQVNRGACENLGYTMEEILQLTPFDIFPEFGPERFEKLIYPLRCGSTSRIVFETEQTRKDSSSYPVEVRLQLTSIDGSSLFLATAQDITERKKLEDQVQVRTAELERSAEELTDFAYIASHDLQEPLRKIIAFGDRLAGKFGSVLNDTGRDYIDRMQKSAIRMKGLIDDLLHFSRVTTHSTPFEKIDLNKVIADVLSDLEVQIERTKGRVEAETLPSIEGGKFQMYQLFQNLISNGLKYHRDGVAPVVKIKYVGSDKNLEEFYVEDNGKGFDEKHLERIFRPFERLHGHSEYGGTGMGLAICYKIVAHHKGQITARSQPNQGATFIVKLPSKQKRE